MKLLYSFAALAVSVTALDDTAELPDPPVCVNDCPLFDLVASGAVDDCAVLSQWSASGCLSDCGITDHAVLAHITNQFCRRLEATDGSYGGSYSSDGTTDETPEPTAAPTAAPTASPPTASPTKSPTLYEYQCQNSLYDQTSICATIAPFALQSSGCQNLVGVQIGPNMFTNNIVTEDDLGMFAAMCPGTCVDMYRDPILGVPQCECTPELYTCLDSVAPPCQNNPEFVTEDGQDVCAIYEALMAQNNIVVDKCNAFANLAVATEGGDYGNYVSTLYAMGTFCPILCDSCDGFAVTAEEDWTPPNPCAPCADAAMCFVNGVFQEMCPAEAAACAPCFPPSADPEDEEPDDEDEEPDDEDEDDEENPLCKTTEIFTACTDTCDDGPEDCAAMEQLVAVGGCANSCLDTQEVLDACIKPYYDELQCTADDFVLTVNGAGAGDGAGDGALVVTLEMQMTFTEPLDTAGVATASGAIEATVATEAGVDEDYVTATMTLADDRRRHLLSISYDVSIIITIPAADLDGADDTFLAALNTLEEMVESGASLEELTAAITSNDSLKELNGGEVPGVSPLTGGTVGDFPIQPTEEPAPASASMVSPALGLLVSAVCVAASL